MGDPPFPTPSWLPTAIAVLALGAAAGCRTVPLPRELSVPPDAGLPAPEELLRLGPNDVLRVRVHGYPELSTPDGPGLSGTRIDPAGTLSLALVGAVDVGGRTLAEARGAIEAAYAVYVKEPKIDVSVVEYAARRFYVYGQVKEPGPYVMDRPLTVYQALSYGGGFERNAAREEIALLRREGERVLVHRIDGTRPDPAGFMAVRPEDFLFVRRTGAGEFSEEVLPYVSAVSQSLATAASLFLIEDRVEDE